MKIAKLFSVIFGAIGAVLMAGTLILCLSSLNKPAKLSDIPEEASRCAEEMMEALSSGDFSAAAKNMYGQPELGAETAPADPMTRQVWDAFVGSISYKFLGECYVSDATICRDAEITVLDVSSITRGLKLRAHALLTARVEAAEDMAELYDETNNFRQDLVDQVMEQAMKEAVAQDAAFLSRTVTLTMVQQDGQWRVVPDQALLQAISGAA